MRCTWNHTLHMSKMIQIRNVPESVHRRLKARAAEAGRSLSDYLLVEIARAAERPTPQELWTRIRSRSVVAPGIPPGEAIRQERDRR